MNIREAVKVLMLSPMYFRMDVRARMELVREFCENFYEGTHFSSDHKRVVPGS